MSVIKFDWNPSSRHLKQFAAIWFPAFAAALGGILWYRFGLRDVALAIWAAAAVLSVAGLIYTPLMRWVWIGVLFVTFPIGWVVSHVLMAVIFYLIFTPIGFIMHLAGYDPMQRRFDKNAGTYWVPRKQTEDASRYFRQF